MQIKELVIGIPFLFFVFWVFTAPIPQDRIGRVCEPINWVGNVATSTTALTAENHTGTTVRWSDKLNYSCQYTIWRLFYQADYNKAVAEGRVVSTTPKTEEGTAPAEAGKDKAAVAEPAKAPVIEPPKELKK